MATAILNRPTLVLNRNWQPVGVVPVAKSLIKVWNESARIVDPVDFQLYSWADWAALTPADNDPVIRTSSLKLRVPEVIVLKSSSRLPSTRVPFSRRNLFKRDQYTCQYCGHQPGSAELTIDHVVPRAQGGTSTWENCVLACIACNAKKADRTPAQARMPLRVQPVRPKWHPLYSIHRVRVDSWSRFLSEAYWSVPLEA
jgi:5-methylcytosine-specific restriction endonuclease McrA